MQTMMAAMSDIQLSNKEVVKIVKGIDAYMEKYGIEDIHELIGAVR